MNQDLKTTLKKTSKMKYIQHLFHFTSTETQTGQVQTLQQSTENMTTPGASNFLIQAINPNASQHAIHESDSHAHTDTPSSQVSRLHDHASHTFDYFLIWFLQHLFRAWLFFCLWSLFSNIKEQKQDAAALSAMFAYAHLKWRFCPTFSIDYDHVVGHR